MVEGYNGLLTATVFLPAVGALVLLLVVKGSRNVRNIAVLLAGAPTPTGSSAATGVLGSPTWGGTRSSC